MHENIFVVNEKVLMTTCQMIILDE